MMVESEAPVLESTDGSLPDEVVREMIYANRIHVRELIVEDEQGQPRALVSCDPQGAHLSLFDANGAENVQIGFGSNGPSVWLCDAADRIVVAIELRHGGGVFTVNRHDGTPALRVDGAPMPKRDLPDAERNDQTADRDAIEQPAGE